MANLRVNKITGTEVFETTGSVQFNDGYLSFDKNILLDLNNYSDWTIECWIYRTANASNTRGLIIGFDVSGDINSNILAVNNDGALYMGSDNGSNATPRIQTSNNIISFNTWYHISAVKKSTSIKLFVNGVESASGTRSTWTFTDLSIPGLIGSRQANDTEFFGHISNLRVIKGQALYTSNFTPPTRELTVIPNTVLLCCQSTTRANEERTGKTITVNGNAVANELTPGLLTDKVKSGGDSAISGSVEFDGNDYLLESTGADGFNGGLGDWTVEAWMYCTDASQPDVLINGLTSSTDRFYINFIGQTLYVGDFSINNIAIGGVKQINSWFHIAVTKSSSTYRAFINGVLIGSSTESLLNSTLTSLQIGYRGSQNYYTKGFISNLRIVKGTALYTSNFIPPTRELKRLPGTVLLCCKNTSDPTAEETGKTITPYGSLDRTNLGVELVTNGTFDTSTTGWTISNASEGSMSVVSGQLVVSNNDTNDPPVYAYQGIPTKIGSTYRVSADIVGGTATSHAVLISTTTSNLNKFAEFTQASADKSTIFTATTTTTYILLRVNANQVATSIFDNVSAIKLDPGTKPAFTPSVGSDGTVTFDGVTKINTPNYFYLPTGNTEDRGRGRGVFGGGYAPGGTTNVIEYINISSTGNAIDFGDFSTRTTYVTSGCSSSIRGIFAGGRIAPSPIIDTNSIDYITISSTGNTQDFGDLLSINYGSGACSSSTRGIIAGGTVAPARSNVIQYITIASTGNAIYFGDLTVTRTGLQNGFSSPTRGLFAGGNSPVNANENVIDYVTIPTTGNAADFGDLTVARREMGACSNSTRGLIFGGASPSIVNVIDYVTISSTGNAADFGDLTQGRENNGSLASSTRGVSGNGILSPTFYNIIDYVNIASTGNALDFGDSTRARYAPASLSDSHGGLG